jgi:hypothetical protein
MKIPEEILALARHLMLFLIAVFAFVSKTLATDSSLTVRLIYVASMLVAFASFIVGYGTMFSVFRHYANPMAAGGEAPRNVIRNLKIQYRLAIYALGLLMVATIFYVVWNDSAPSG